jgi:hypothetical protein
MCASRILLLSTLLLATAAQPVQAQSAHAQPSKIIVQKDLVYGRVQGAGLLADIAYPEGSQKLPVIRSVHGGRAAAQRQASPILHISDKPNPSSSSTPTTTAPSPSSKPAPWPPPSNGPKPPTASASSKNKATCGSRMM